MSSLSSASATAGGTETVESLLRRCSSNLKSLSVDLCDTKKSVLGLAVFLLLLAHGNPIPNDATQCLRFRKGLQKGIYSQISTDVNKRRKDFFNNHHSGNWTDTLAEFVQLIQDDENFAKLGRDNTKPEQESTGDDDAGGKTERKSRSQRRKEYRKKKAAENEEAALSNNTQTDEGTKSGTTCCGKNGHSRNKCFYRDSVETLIQKANASMGRWVPRRFEL